MDLKEKVFKALEDPGVKKHFENEKGWVDGTCAVEVMKNEFDWLERHGSYSLDDLRTNGHAGDFAHALSYFPADTLSDFGVEYLFLVWTSSFRKERFSSKVSQVLNLPEELLETVRKKVNDFCVHDGRERDRFGDRIFPLARIYDGIDGFISSYDLQNLVVNSRSSPIKASKLRKYSLLPMMPIMDNYEGHGWKNKEIKGKNYKIWLDSPFAVALMFNGHPNAVFAGVPVDATAFHINQIQMVKPHIILEDRKIDKPIYQGTARGLNGLRSWPEMMVRLAEDTMRHFGFKELQVQFGENNKWTRVKYRQDGSFHVTKEMAKEVYDDTARNLDYKRRAIERQYKPTIEHWHKRL